MLVATMAIRRTRLRVMVLKVKPIWKWGAIIELLVLRFRSGVWGVDHWESVK